MFKKVSYRLLKSGIAIIIVTYFLALIFFFPGSETHILAQDEANLSVAPNPANPGATIMVNGFEYPAAKKVAVYFQDKANGVVNATTNAGGFFNAALKLPKQYINGATYVYSACDGSTTKALLKFAKNDVAKTRVSIEAGYSPQIQLSAFVGPIKKSVSVTGNGFQGGEQVHIEFQGVLVGVATADRNGDFIARFNVPTWARNSPYYDDVRATGRQSSASASASFQVLPSVSLSSNTGLPGQQVTATGSQFTPGESMQALLFSPSQGASSVGTPLVSPGVSSQGTFETHLTIPSNVKRRTVYSILYIDVASGLDVVTYFKVQ